MRRALAILSAVVLVVLAVVIRSRLDAGTESRQAEANRPRGTLVCATELTPVCEQLHNRAPDVTVRIEDAGTTARTMSAEGFDPAASGIDAWIAPDPYVRMVNETRARSSLAAALETPSSVLARTPMVAAIWTDRLAALRSSCPDGDVTWTCIGDFSGTPWSQHSGQTSWGAVKVRHPSADLNASGLLVVAQATAHKLGRTDYASNDLDDSAYRSWLSRLEIDANDPAPSRDPEFGAMVSLGPSSFGVAGVTEAVAGPVADRRKDRLSILYPSPVATMDIVAAPVASSQNGARVQSLLTDSTTADALAAAGWRVEGKAPVAGVRADVPLPAGNGLPAPGVLQRLQSVWTESKP